jgi:hypothetical protein
MCCSRLRPTLPEELHQSQHCGLPGNTTFDAVATVRDAIAYVELTHAQLCIVSLDFTAALTESRTHISFGCYGFMDVVRVSSLS